MNRLALVLVLVAAGACKKKAEERPSPGTAPPSSDAPAPAPAQALEVMEATAIESPAALCAEKRAEGRTDGCNVKKPLRSLAAAAPFKSVLITESGEPAEGMATQHDYHVLLQTEKGWFVASFEQNDDGGTYGVGVDELVAADFAVQGTPEVVVRYSDEGIDTDQDLTYKRTGVFVCGLGASGTPGCVRIVLSEQANKQNEPDVDRRDWKLDARPTADGVELTKAGGTTAPPQLGAFTVAFP